VLYLPYCRTSHGRERERDRGKKRCISVKCFTFPVAPLMVTSAREIEALKKRRWPGGEEMSRHRCSRGKRIASGKTNSITLKGPRNIITCYGDAVPWSMMVMLLVLPLASPTYSQNFH